MELPEIRVFSADASPLSVDLPPPPPPQPRRSAVSCSGSENSSVASKFRKGSSNCQSMHLMDVVTDDCTRRETKTIVYVQMVFMKLGEIDTIKETFSADVFIQARWREPRLDGSQMAKNINPETINWDQYWNPRIYVDNTVDDPQETIGHTVVYDVNAWQAYIVERHRLKGTFLENLELFHFPFDTQDITITLMSERLEDEVQLLDDHKQPSTINVESFVDEQEWRLYQEVETFNGVVNKFYEGDATEMCAHPSFSCRTHASRRPGFYITNIFVVMFFIGSMAFATYAVHIQKPENRLDLAFILLLTTVAFKFTVNSSLPRISYLTTMDVYIMMSMTVLVLVCIWHAIIPQIAADWGLPLAHTADIVVLSVLGSIFVIIHIIFALWITTRALRRKKYYEEKERFHMRRLKKDEKLKSGSENLQDVRRASMLVRD